MLTTVNDLYWTDDDRFEYKDGFNVAVAFTAYDSNPEWILDKSYGELFFNHFQWGPVGDTYITERKRLNHHTCSREELGLEGEVENSRFHPLHESA